MSEETPIRDLEGRSLIQALNRLSWRFETLEQDYKELMEIKTPSLPENSRNHRYEGRGKLYEAERRLHHFLAGYYTYTEIIETVANASVEESGERAVDSQMGRYSASDESSEIMGLRIYVQHKDILPILIRESSHTEGPPRIAINKEELQMDEGYRSGFDYHYGHIQGNCLYPLQTIKDHWPEIEALHEDIVDTIKTHNEDHLDEYESRLRELKDIRDEFVIPELRDRMDID